MATSAANIEFLPDDPIGFIPDENPTAGGIEFIPDQPEVSPEVVQQEAVRNSLGAVQALDVMAAPQSFDWSDVAEQTDRDRFRAAEEAGARARIAEDRGSGTGPGSEAYAWRRERDFQLGQISPNTTIGRQLVRQRQGELQDIEQIPEERSTPSELLSGFMGPGLSATAQPIVESAARGVGPATGGALGAAMYTLPTAHPLGLLAALAGGFIGSQFGGAAQEEVLKSTETPEETADRRQRTAEEVERNPWAARIGSMASSSPFFRPGLAQFGQAIAGDRGALRNIGIAGGIGAGAEVVGSKIMGKDVDIGDVLSGALGNMIMNEPTRLGRRLGFLPSSEQQAFEAAQKYEGMPAEATPVAEDLQSGLTTRGTTSTADVFAGIRRQPAEEVTPIEFFPEITPTEVTSDAQQISETSTPDGGVRPSEVAPENVPLSAPEGGEGVQPSGQGGPLVEGTPEAPRQVTEPTSPVIEEAGTARPQRGGATGIRNAVVDENRRIAGLPPREQPLARSSPTIHEEARAALAQDPEMGGRLVRQLTEEIRPLTDTEDAVLTFEQNTREQARTEAVDAVNNAKTPEELDAAQQRLAEADNRLFEVYQVGQNAGTANARGLNARKLMQNRDFTLSKMLNETRAIVNDGQPLTEKQTAEVTAAHARIAELEAKLAEVESGQAARNAQMEYRRMLRETNAEAKKAGKARESQPDFLTRIRESAKNRIKERRGRLQVTIDPLNIAGLVDEAIVGATYVAEGIRDFGKWSARMVEEFGERIKPQLQALFQRASTLSDDLTKSYKAGTPDTPADVVGRIQEGAKLEQKVVYDLYRAHVNAGTEDFTAATKSVTSDLQSKFPSVTERQVMDALSGYGKTTTPSKEKDLAQLREFRNLARLTSQLEDAQRGIAPLKTGPQRDKATAKVRELQKQVNAAMKKLGIKTGGESRIASAHDARVTRLKNAIEETEAAIQSGKRPERAESTPWTPEELALKQQLTEARERLDGVLGEPESDRLNSILKAIERAEEKIRTENLEPNTRLLGPQTREVTEATSRLREANKKLAEMRREKRLKENPPKTEDQKRLSTLEKRRDELIDQVSKGDTGTKVGRATADTQEQATIRAEITALNKQLADIRKAARPQKPADELQYNMLQKRIFVLSEKISKGEIETATGRPTVETQRVAEAKAQLAKLNEQMAEMRKAAQPQKPADQAAYKNLVKRLADAEARLAAGDLTSSTRRKATAETQRIAETRAKLQEVNQQIQELRNSSDELRLERDKRALQNRIKEVQDRIARGDYEVPPKREPAIDREKIDLQYQLAKAKEKWQEGVIEAKRAKRPLGTKIWDTIKESANLSRAVVTSMDLPPVFRQGLFAIGRPVMAAKAVKDALIAFGSEKKAFEVQQEIENRPNSPLYERAKLYLAKDTTQPLNRQEEAYMGNWFRKLPRWTLVGPALRASERTYNTFLNKIRADTFDAAVKAYDVAPTDTATLKRLGDIINTMTGRSTLPGGLEKAAVGLNTFLFAPRFMASRFKIALGEPLWTGNAKTRTFALEQYARTLAGAALIYGLAKTAGYEVETDPRSSNFLKIRIGNTMLDPLGGLSQVTTFLTRAITGETKTQKGKTVPLREPFRPLELADRVFGSNVAARGKPNKFSGGVDDVLKRFLRTKLNPVVGQAVNVATGRDVTGEEVTPSSVAKNLALPISFQDILTTMEKQGVPRGTALTILSLFGMGLQNYD